MKTYLNKYFLEARTRPRGSLENFHEGWQNNKSEENDLLKEVIAKKQMIGFLWDCNPLRKNLGSWLIKVLGLLFIFTMASKIYLLNSFPELHARDKSFIYPLLVINETRRSSLQEKQPILHNTKILFPQDIQTREIWRPSIHEQYYKCSQRTKKEIRASTATDGYIIITANGGLNQMRAGISDMVAIAHLMNATLVRPKLDHNSYWKDKSEFSDIYNWERFIEVLKNDVVVVEDIPPEFQTRKFLVKAPISWSKANYYKWEMSRLLKKYKVIHFTHTNSRLANNGLSGSIQRLRCRAMFESLQYTDEIKLHANSFIKSLRRNNNPYVALHLRYEKDILAFTACTHNLSSDETKELTSMRRHTPHWKEKRINGEQKRLEGACPMTPREVSIFLEALGFPNDTVIYIVAGEIYGHNGYEPLRAKYPNLFDHTSLSIEDEASSFQDHSNKLAAIDYMVAVESDTFIYTYDGHMAKAVKGHRLFEGFRNTIIPDIKKFVKLIDLLDKKHISWEEFSFKVKHLHLGRTNAPTFRQVGPTPQSEENFYANPYPGCICEKSR